jgi:hypothetical protein
MKVPNTKYHGNPANAKRGQAVGQNSKSKYALFVTLKTNFFDRCP